MLEDVLYYWKVVAKDDDGGEKASECWSFWTNSINSAPNEFTLTAPEQNAQTGLMPTFNWTASSDADLYDEIAYTLSYGTSPSNLQDITSFSENAGNFSLNFDGTDDYVEVPYPNSITELTEQISYSAWFKVDSELDRQNIFVVMDNFPGHTQGFILRTGSDMADGSDGGYIYSNFVTNSGSRTVQSPTNDLAENEGEWINATVTYSSEGELKLFVNGVLKAEENIPGGLIPHDDTMIIGRMNEDLNYHNGKIDKIGIWSRDLSASEVLEIAQGTDFDQISSGLVAHWDFNQGSGDILVDQTGNGNDGLIYGATWVEETSENGSASVLVSDNYSLNFNGSSDYIDCGISEDYNFYEFTTEFWINVEGASSENQSLICKGDGGNSEQFMLDIWRGNNSLKIGFGINNRTGNARHAATNNVIEYGEWMHVAGVYDGDSLKIYINGIRNAALYADVPMEIANDRIFIGKANHNEVSKFGGEMDEFRLWNYARSPEQILSNMNYELSGLEQGLVAYWDFNEGTGGVLEDKSVNENNATIVGAEWTSESPSLYNSNGLALGTSYTPGENLDDNTEYFWQVMASDLSGATYTTPLQSFIVNVGDDSPQNLH